MRERAFRRVKCGSAVQFRALANSAVCGGAAIAAPTAAQPPCGVCAFCRVIKINNLGWCEAPPAVEHPRRTEKPPGTPSGRRLRLEIALSPVERLFPPSGGSLTREREGRGRNFSFTVLRLFFWLQKKRGKHRTADESTEEYCGAVKQSKRYHWSPIQPLIQLR